MRTHKQNLKHLRDELTKQGANVVSVRQNARTRLYSGFSCNFVQGGHVFVWDARSPLVSVRRVDSTGREVECGTLTIAE